MLIMAIIGTLTPTLFYQTYGNVSILKFSLRPLLRVPSAVPTRLRRLPRGFYWLPVDMRSLLLRAPRPNQRPLLPEYGQVPDVFLCGYFDLCKYIWLLFAFLFFLWIGSTDTSSSSFINPVIPYRPMVLSPHARFADMAESPTAAQSERSSGSSASSICPQRETKLVP